jgi:hypothetical protein
MSHDQSRVAVARGSVKSTEDGYVLKYQELFQYVAGLCCTCLDSSLNLYSSCLLVAWSYRMTPVTFQHHLMIFIVSTIMLYHRHTDSWFVEVLVVIPSMSLELLGLTVRIYPGERVHRTACD